MFELPSPRHLATECWVKSTWKFLSEHDLKIRDEAGGSLRLQRENDCFIIPWLFQHNFRGKDLAMLNRCRIYLQATTLADLVEGNGNRLRREAWDGTGPIGQSRFAWPIQGKPPKQAWLRWQCALAKAFGVHMPGWKLEVPLGRWLYHELARLDWEWFLSEEDERLYRNLPTGWSVHPRNPGGRRRTRSACHTYSRHGVPYDQPLPSDLVRTTIF